jgi:hypothetical protein
MQGQEALSSVSQELAKTEALTAWELQQISRLCSDSLVLSNACEPYGDSLGMQRIGTLCLAFTAVYLRTHLEV